MLATSSGITFKTRRGEIVVMTPVAFRDHFGTEPPDIEGGARLTALRFTIREIGALKRLLSGAQLPFADHVDRIIIGPDRAMGATLTFER